MAVAIERGVSYRQKTEGTTSHSRIEQRRGDKVYIFTNDPLMPGFTVFEQALIGVVPVTQQRKQTLFEALSFLDSAEDILPQEQEREAEVLRLARDMLTDFARRGLI